MKIVHIDGVTHIRLDHVDELPAAMAMLPGAGKHHVEIMMPAEAALEPPPVSAVPATATPARRTPSLARIGTVYLTKTAAELTSLLAEHPGGLTTRQVVLIRHRDELMGYHDREDVEERVKELVMALSPHMAAAQDRYGMIRKVKGSWVWTLSGLGKIGNYQIDTRPIYKNRLNKPLNRYLAALKAGDVE